MTSVCGVIVTYEPDLARLAEAISRTTSQVDALIVVDNGPERLELDGVEVIRPGGNVGLAAAQNLGIAWARDHSHTHVLLLDQDSWPEPGMVPALLAASTGRWHRRRRSAAPRPAHRHVRAVHPRTVPAEPQARRRERDGAASTS